MAKAKRKSKAKPTRKHGKKAKPVKALKKKKAAPARARPRPAAKKAKAVKHPKAAKPLKAKGTVSDLVGEQRR